MKDIGIVSNAKETFRQIVDPSMSSITLFSTTLRAQMNDIKTQIIHCLKPIGPELNPQSVVHMSMALQRPTKYVLLSLFPALGSKHTRLHCLSAPPLLSTTTNRVPSPTYTSHLGIHPRRRIHPGLSVSSPHTLDPRKPWSLLCTKPYPYRHRNLPPTTQCHIPRRIRRHSRCSPLDSR